MTREKLPKPAVLVVDDEPLIRWSLSEGLGESGFVVRLASSGAEARAALTACADEGVVVLLDMRLPDVVDLSLLREIRQRWPAVPVVIMTAHGTLEDQAKAVELGAFRFVDKPFDVGEIASVVADAWAHRPA